LDLNNLEEEFVMRKESLTGEKVERVEDAPAPAAVAAPPPKVEEEVAEIGYEDFAKVKLIIAKVLKAEAVPGADKLIRLTLDDGKVQDRTVVSGIRAHFTPEQMVGQTITIVDNLKPRKIFGILSQGMILAAGDGEVLRLMVPAGDLKPGVRVG
jgi:methionine--tRNA ligase beta chain